MPPNQYAKEAGEGQLKVLRPDRTVCETVVCTRERDLSNSPRFTIVYVQKGNARRRNAGYNVNRVTFIERLLAARDDIWPDTGRANAGALCIY